MALSDLFSSPRPKPPAGIAPAGHDTPDEFASREKTAAFPGGSDGVDKIVTADGPVPGGREVGKEDVNAFTSAGDDALRPTEGQGVIDESYTVMGTETQQRQKDRHPVDDTPTEVIDPSAFHKEIVATLKGLKESTSLLVDSVAKLSPAGPVSGHANGASSVKMLAFPHPDPIKSGEPRSQESAELRAQLDALQAQVADMRASVSAGGGVTGAVGGADAPHAVYEGVNFFFVSAASRLPKKPVYLAIDSKGTLPATLPYDARCPHRRALLARAFAPPRAIGSYRRYSDSGSRPGGGPCDEWPRPLERLPRLRWLGDRDPRRRPSRGV